MRGKSPYWNFFETKCTKHVDGMILNEYMNRRVDGMVDVDDGLVKEIK